MNCDMMEEANDILKNGILVETNKGLVCLSVTDALSTNLQLSAEDLKNVATQLILQQHVGDFTTIDSSFFPCHSLSTSEVSTDSTAIDSDELTSECSDAAANNPTTTKYLPKTSNNWHHVPDKLFKGIKHAKNVTIPSSKIIVKTASLRQRNKINVAAKTPINISCITEDASGSSVLPTKKLNISGDFYLKPAAKEIILNETKPLKRRGGWPKGRKRKPELLHLPPKAPATGYNLYMNEMRKQFKESPLAFHEITKVVGNQWSNLSLEEKKPYLIRAEEDKKRYREELKNYRKSGAYQLYLAKKRRRRDQYNIPSESDMDATDDIDDEDNEELYCRTCDQWFHNLHNKREHLQGRQHKQAVAGDMTRELGKRGTNLNGSSSTTLSDETNLDGSSELKTSDLGTSIGDSITNLMSLISKRDKEIKLLKGQLQESKDGYNAMHQQLSSLLIREANLKNSLYLLQEKEKQMHLKLYKLWQVPSWFIITDDVEPDFQNSSSSE